MQKPQDVGIVALEIYIPKLYVDQEDLEIYDQAGKGKYTIGLGQKRMAFLDINQDINSVALTVTHNLLEKYNINPKSIGRLEVGTETFIDKSKSVKTTLMRLFSSHGNHDIEGVTSTNACYGATNAFFNTVNWIESSSWDGRYGLVVAADIAVYEKGRARPSGGAGAVAFLVGPNAPFVIEPIRASFFSDEYDFYKPDPKSDYPVVDGQLSIKCFLDALSQCYATLTDKLATKTHEHDFALKKIDFACFHTPFTKLVYKAFMKLWYLDAVRGLIPEVKSEEIEILKNNQYDSKEVQSLVQKLSKTYWQNIAQNSVFLNTELGNIYTGSLYANLISLIQNNKIELQNKRILMYSYGSGLASSLFLLRCTQNVSYMRDILQIQERLSKRIKMSPESYNQSMDERASILGVKNIEFQTDFDKLFDGTYYLTKIDDKWRRFYQRYTHKQHNLQQNKVKSNTTLQQNVNKQGADDNEILQNRISTLRGQIVSNMNNENDNKPRDSYEEQSLIWKGFYSKTLPERHHLLIKKHPNMNIQHFETGGIKPATADLMVENCIGKIALPIGLGLNFKINGKPVTIPMAMEEPSVIAASSSAAKFIAENGDGFTTYSTKPIMIGQIQLLDIYEIPATLHLLESIREKIIDKANEACTNMVSRGGGVKDVRFKRLKINEQYKSEGINDMIIIELLVNVCESMGANIINTICEHTSSFIEAVTGGRVGLRILSNLCVERRAVAQFSIPIKKMGWKNLTGEEVALRMLEGYLFAKEDPYRAATHNKGIMNGIDAVAIATGQDWRAIESACHTFASMRKYEPLTHYEIIRKGNGEAKFYGYFEIPISVGTKGGVLETNPIYQNTFQILGFPNARQLSEIMACVGLAQNFAALRALVVEGIQKGHMALHAKNLAVSAGVPNHLALEASEFMSTSGRVNSDSAKAYLEAHNLYSELRVNNTQSKLSKPLSTFLIEVKPKTLNETITIHFALECLDNRPNHLSIEQRPKNQQKQHLKLQKLIFGDKGYEWFCSFLNVLEQIRFTNSEVESQVRKTTVMKLKILSILINLVTFNMIRLNKKGTIQLLKKVKAKENLHEFVLNFKDEPSEIRYGFSLLGEAINIFKYILDNLISSQWIKNQLDSELVQIIDGIVQTYQLQENSIKGQFNFNAYVNHRKKRLSGTMMLYCDALLLLENELSPEYFELLSKIGYIYEIEAMVARDINRPKINEENVFLYWLNMNGCENQFNNEIERQKFVNQIRRTLTTNKTSIEKELDQHQKKLYHLTLTRIQEHFQNDNEKMSLIKSKL